MAINIQLEQLYEEDRKERENLIETPETLELLNSHNQQSLNILRKILPEIDTNEIWNCHYIAYLLQHGETTEDYKLAHKYAKKAVDLGSNVSKWLYAATLDRWLVSQDKLQKFGTQFKQVNGQWKQLPVDGSITDTERAEYGVPPLSAALQKFTEKYNK